MSQLAVLFEHGRARDYQDECGAIKCSASYWFVLYALLRHWVLAYIPEDPRVDKIRSCVLHGLDCIASMTAAKSGRISYPEAHER